jgi:hypothetical protein
VRGDMSQMLGAGRPFVVAIVLGWQTTIKSEIPYRNVRYGIKIYPTEQRWEVTEDI